MSDFPNPVVERDVENVLSYIEAQFRDASAIHRARFPSASDPSREVGVLSATDVPSLGFTSWATFGVMHVDWTPNNLPVRLELVACLRGDIAFGRVMGTAAHHVRDTRFLPRPGAVMRDVVRLCDVDGIAEGMNHALFLHPFSWGETGFDSVDLSPNPLWFAQMQPIYDEEADFIANHGFEAFEDILIEEEIPLENPQRPNTIY